MRFSSSVGYAFPAFSARTDRSSNSIIAYSLLRCRVLLRAIEVYVPRWNSKYSSPIQVGRRLLSFTFSCSSSKYVLANAWRTFGTPLMPFPFVWMSQASFWSAAAAVPVAITDQNIVVDILILIAVPAAHDCIRMQHAVVCRKEAGLRLADAERCDHMRETLLPSIPSQFMVSYGTLLNSFHASFVVMK